MNIFIPKKLPLIGAGALIIVVGILIGGASDHSPANAPETSSSAPQESKSGNLDSESYRVARVIDGDTIEL